MTYANQTDFLEALSTPVEKLCKQCDTKITFKRSTKVFCSDNCRKNNSRPIPNAQSSPAKAREQMEYFDRVNYSYELYLDNLGVNKRPPLISGEVLKYLKGEHVVIYQK